jgi:hypothetical protein
MFGATGCDSFSPPSRTTSGESVVSSQNTGIWVSGEGKVTVTPDVAILSLGVEAQADTVDQAQTEASAAMNAVISELTSRGVAVNDIKTQYFSIYPVRNWVPDTGEEELAGYRVTNMVTVKIKILPQESYTLDYKAGNIVDAVAKAGGNYIRIDNISFTVDDPAPHQKEARKKALADARAKAEQIATTANVRLGEPTYINEVTSYYPMPYQMTYGMAVPAPAPIPAASIISGETEIIITVQVAYSIK